MAPNDLKWAKNDPKRPKNDILMYGVPTWDRYRKKMHSAFLNFWHRGTVSEIYAKKTKFWPRNGPKMVTKHSGKQSIGLPGIVSFLHVGKGSQGHVLDRSGPIWPTWNTPKKGFLSRKTPKNGVKMGWGHFHERVNRSPIRCGHFGANGSKISRFVSEIRPFKEKVPV